MRIITGTSNDEQVTARERELAEKIMQDIKFEEQVGRHMACHNRFRLNALRELEQKIEDVSAQLENLEDEKFVFEDTWNVKWDKRYENVVMLIIQQKAQDGEIPPEQNTPDGETSTDDS